MSLNKFSSAQEKKEVSDVVYEKLMEYFFEEVVFINLAYTDLGVPTTKVTIGGVDYQLTRDDARAGTTSTTDFGKASRIIDSANGRLMKPGKSSRMRCQFYLRSPSKLDGYILSPAVYDAVSLPSSLTDMSVFRSYVGIKFIGGQVYAAIKEAGELEVIYPLGLTIELDGATFSKTYALEIRHDVRFTEIIINNQSYGTFASDMLGSGNETVTFYPFFAPARSDDGTQVNLVAENIQFIQKRK